MSEVFGDVYAGIYDALYGDKDYAGEVDLVERLFREFGDGAVRSVLDLGCGTGGHAIPLAGRGYEVTGVDRSDAMLSRARRKATGLSPGKSVSFVAGDIRDAELGRSFDAVLMMFAVLSYLPENDDVLAALRNARRHLRPGGLLVGDVWYGPAVLRERPSPRLKVVPTTRGRILRSAAATLDVARHLCTVRYEAWSLEEGRLAAETSESHRMRYFFPREIALFLETAGFSLERLGVFPDFDRDPDETTWNVLAAARAL